MVVDVGRRRLDAGRGAAADDRDRGGRRDGELVGEAVVEAEVGGVGTGAAFLAERNGGIVALAADVLEHLLVPHLGHHRFERDVVGLQEGVEAHDAEADRTLAHGGVGGAGEVAAGRIDEALQHVVEKAHHVVDEGRMLVPLEIGFEIERAEAAHRGALLAVMVDAGRQRDLAAQVRGLDLEAGQLVMLGPGVVHVVDEDQVGLAGLDARRQDADPQVAGRDLALHRAVLGADQRPFLVVLDGAHEGVGDQQAMMEVERLAVGIAAGRAADFDEFLDLGMVDRQVAGGRTAAQRALADRQRQRVHDADERHHARGLAVHADLFADRTQVAPVGADAATTGSQPDVLVPQADDAFERIVGLIQEARDRQATAGAAVAQHRRRRHEPQVADVVVKPLRVAVVVGIGRGDAGEHVLVGLAG